MADRAEVISVEQLTHAAFTGVLAALKEREIRPEEFPGPILVGIIAWPELSKFAPRAAGAVSDAER